MRLGWWGPREGGGGASRGWLQAAGVGCRLDDPARAQTHMLMHALRATQSLSASRAHPPPPPPPRPSYVASGPMVRSSYKAGEVFLESMIHKDRGQQAAH